MVVVTSTMRKAIQRGAAAVGGLAASGALCGLSSSASRSAFSHSYAYFGARLKFYT